MTNFLEEIVQETQSRVPGELVALALVGSRASYFENPESDYDLVAVLEESFDPHYRRFSHKGTKIDLMVVGKTEFEEDIDYDIPPFSTGPKLVHFDYKGLVGEDYLAEVEAVARKKLVERFIASLPEVKRVKASARQLTEWPLLAQARSQPLFTYRLRRVVRAPVDVLRPVEEKNKQLLSKLGYEPDQFGLYTFEHTPKEEEEQTDPTLSFVERVGMKAYNYFTHKSIRHPQMLALGIAHVALQLPEHVANTVLGQREFGRLGDALIYNAPTLAEYCEERRVFTPFSNASRALQKKLWKIRELEE